MIKETKFVPVRPKFTQENFEKLFNEHDKLTTFIIKFTRLPWWKRAFFGRKIIHKYLTGKS